jgi:hypothetical protein
MTTKKGLFNWSGIKDNEDGTFTVKSKIEKKCLLKELHKQGVAIRSKRDDNGTITVSSIGLKPARKRVGHRPRLQYPLAPKPRHGYGNPSQYFYPQGSPRPLFRRLPLYAPPPKPHMINNTSRKVEEWARQRIEKRNREQKEKLLQKKNAEEINEKMRRERIEREREQTANTVRSQKTHAKLLKERQQHERHENAERMRSNIADNYGRGPSNTRSESIDHNELSAQRTEAIENRSNL